MGVSGGGRRWCHNEVRLERGPQRWNEERKAKKTQAWLSKESEEKKKNRQGREGKMKQYYPDPSRERTCR